MPAQAQSIEDILSEVRGLQGGESSRRKAPAPKVSRIAMTGADAGLPDPRVTARESAELHASLASPDRARAPRAASSSDAKFARLETIILNLTEAVQTFGGELVEAVQMLRSVTSELRTQGALQEAEEARLPVPSKREVVTPEEDVVEPFISDTSIQLPATSFILENIASAEPLGDGGAFGNDLQRGPASDTDRAVMDALLGSTDG